MRYDEYRSPLDKVNGWLKRKLHRGDIYNSLLIGGLLYIAGAALALWAGELEGFLLDYAALALIFGIAFMLYMETYVGDRYRKVAQGLSDTLQYDSRQDFRRIFNNPLRIIAGLAVAAVVILVFVELLNQNVWYDSLYLRIYLALLGTLIGYIGGEAAVGVFATVIYVRRLAKGVSRSLDLFNPDHLNLLKAIATWGSDLSGYGGIVASVVLAAFFFAPWKSGLSVVSRLSLVFLVAAVVILVFVFSTVLISVHDAMRGWKEEQRGLIARKVEVVFEKLQDAMVRGDPLATEKAVASLNVESAGLDWMRSQVEALPTFPLDLAMVRTFSSSIVIPILVYVLQLVASSALR